MGSSILATEVSTIDKRVADCVIVRQRNPRVSPTNHASPVGDPTDFSKLQLSSVLEDMSNSLIRGSVVDEGTLDLVEILEKLLLRQRSVVIKESHRSAYCWMAVECTLRFMWPSSASEVFTDAVERIWTKRIWVLKEKGSGLVSDELLRWEIDLKKAAEDPEMYERIRKSDVRYNAMSSLNLLLREQGALPGSSSPGVCKREDPNDVDENIRRLESDKIEGEDGNRDVGGVGSVEDDGSGEHAEEEEPTVGTQEQEHEPSLVKMAARELKNDYLLKPNHSVEVITPRPSRVTRSRTSRQGLIVTPARVNASVKGSGSRKTRSGGVRSRSVPLKKPRRIKNYWTCKEVEALREGIQKYGTSWKNIKNAYPAVLAKRTQVDLKDKWRNLPDLQ